MLHRSQSPLSINVPIIHEISRFSGSCFRISPFVLTLVIWNLPMLRAVRQLMVFPSDTLTFGMTSQAILPTNMMCPTIRPDNILSICHWTVQILSSKHQITVKRPFLVLFFSAVEFYVRSGNRGCCYLQVFLKFYESSSTVGQLWRQEMTFFWTQSSNSTMTNKISIEERYQKNTSIPTINIFLLCFL